MIIEYLGHSAFLIKGEKSVVLDPFKSIGYDMQKVTCDYCISSHNHFDHNAFDRVNCSKIAAQADGVTPIGFEGINLSRIKTYHDDKMGKLRGDNYVSVFSIDGVTFAHLGDLGEADNQQLIAALNGVDVLFIPVGGTYTIDALAAKNYCQRIKPKIIIPMHFKTEKSTVDIAPIEEFLKLFDDYKKVENLINFNINQYTYPQILVFDHAKF